MTLLSIFFASLGVILGIGIIFGVSRIVFYSQRAVAAGKRVVPVSNNPANASVRILVIGDSTSYGTGAERPENSLVGRLVNDYPEVTIINASENSMDLRRLYKKLLDMTDEHFDIAIIHIGGMDTITFTRSNTICSYLKKINSRAREMGAHTVILVSMNNVGALPIGFFPLNKIYDRRSHHITHIFSKICSECDIVHVPLCVPIEEEPLLHDAGSYFSKDKLHPNDEGYGLWYAKIKSMIHPHIQK